MNNATQELTFDRLDQVSGGDWVRHPPGKGWDPTRHPVPTQSSQVGAERYLPLNKNNDVRSFLMTFF